MKIIGITGSSGSGKSFISKILLNKYYNVFIIDADKIAKQMSSIDTLYYKEIVNIFGKNIITEDLEINRVMLAEIIFSDDEK
ncbi:MAG: dephospho-CoA kinase, partial [Clostridia bacterium]|nr:dephospho-CoA kinase [Clostridia bacterium]